MTFNGPSGVLEGLVTGPVQPTGSAVLCHPHPQYGGNMSDAIVGVMESALVESGYAVLRFNFRGTGASEGNFDGKAEVDDFLAAVDASAGLTGVRATIVGGYSFGAMIALMGYADSKASKLLLTAPPLRLGQVKQDPDDSMLVMLGSDDQIVPVATTSDHFANARVEVLEGADHFFFGHSDAIRAHVKGFV